MKKFLLPFLMAISLVNYAQVSNPELTYVALPQTGFTATVDAFQDAPRDGSKAVDNNTSTYWETKWNPSPATPLPHWIIVDMNSVQNIDGIYIVDRNNQGNSIKTCTVSTSADGITWTQQGGTFSPPYNSTFTKIFFGFPATVNCRYYRIDITANQTTNNQVTNLAETGAAIRTVVDPNAYSRANWIVVASSASSSAANTIDQNAVTFWQSVWNATPPAPYPHTLLYDMQQAQPVNQLYYIQRNHLNSSAYSGSVAFSDDGINFGTELPVQFAAGTNKNFINLPTVQNHRYFRVTFTKNYYAKNNPNDLNNSAYYATTMAEVGALYNTALSATLLSFNAQSQSAGVELTWATSAEQDADGYNITRSSDGLNFSTIGSISIPANTMDVSNYSFSDNAPATGTNFYRLERVMANATVEKSHVINTGYPLGNFVGDNPKNLNVVYFIPSDISACADFEARLSNILLNMQDFYGNEMQRNGRGYKTFGLVKDIAQQKVKLIVINGKFNHNSYPYTGGGPAVEGEIDAYKAAHPSEFSGSHYLVIIPAYNYNASGEPGGGPFYGTGKYCYALDYPDMKQELLGTGGTLGNRAVKWIGGMAHELGHGLNLPHNCAKVSEVSVLGTYLMGAGNFTYGKSTTSLGAADCAVLNNNEVFNDGTISYYGPSSATVSSINAFFSPEKNAIVISGKATATGSPLTDVSFYNDANFRNSNGTYNGFGGNKDYDAVTWNSPVIGTDSFYIEMPITDFQYNDSVLYELRVRMVLQNGNVSTRTYHYYFVNNIPVLNFGNKQWITRNDWVILANSEDPSGPDENMLDKNNSTTWTPLVSQNNFPYDVKVDMQRSLALAGITITNNPGALNDAPRRVDVEVSSDDVNWLSVITNYELPKSTGPNNISFDQFATARYFRIRINTTWGGITVNPAITEVNAFTNLLNKAPEFSVAADTIVYKGSDCSYNVDSAITGGVTAIYDDYYESPVTSFTDVLTTGTVAGETVITRSWRVTDEAGLFIEKNQVITVKDTTSPVVSGTETIALCNETDGSYSIPTITAVDNCSVNTIAYEITGATNRAGTGVDASGSFNPGVSTIVWTVIDNSGNTAAFQATVRVNEALSASIADVYAVNPGGEANTIYLGYGPSSLTLNVVASGGTPQYSYAWSDWGTASDNPVSPSTAGVYTYTVTITDASGCAMTISKTIHVVDIRCGIDKVVMCHSANANHDNDLCLSVTAVVDHLSHGCHLGECKVITSARSAQKPQTIEKKAEEFFIQAYPNPSASQFQLLLLGNNTEVFLIKVVDMHGRLVQQLKSAPGRTISFGHELKAGTYFVEVWQGVKQQVVKLIKL